MLSRRYFLSYVYLFFAFLGIALPTLANIEFLQLYGYNFDIKLFVDLANINPAAKSLSRDLLISSSAVILWMYFESKRLGMKRFWLILVSTFTIAFAFSAPLFLFFRERHLINLDESYVDK